MTDQTDLYIPSHVLRKPLGSEAVRLILRHSRRFKDDEFYQRKDIGAVIVEAFRAVSGT